MLRLIYSCTINGKFNCTQYNVSEEVTWKSAPQNIQHYILHLSDHCGWCNVLNRVWMKDNLLMVWVTVLYYLCPNLLFLLVGKEVNLSKQQVFMITIGFQILDLYEISCYLTSLTNTGYCLKLTVVVKCTSKTSTKLYT